MDKEQLLIKIAKSSLMVLLFYLVLNYHFAGYVQLLMWVSMVALIWTPNSFANRQRK
ncbi:hypothetical protein ACFQHW_10100 [Lapidilactobacillus achengensis]|uniref:Uncharacterized protein n=1 Tax=Lapidilactobacillus achengensis TaxID=2486000 RepID=A0ABW1USB0_9LACO|nr:hypothetical protein [Lapidilactobacillus achengensis]